MKHKIEGLTKIHCECKFCGRALEYTSTCDSRVPPKNEHTHFTLVNTFEATCARCGVTVSWRIKHEKINLAPSERSTHHYVRQHPV